MFAFFYRSRNRRFVQGLVHHLTASVLDRTYHTLIVLANLVLLEAIGLGQDTPDVSGFLKVILSVLKPK